MSSLLSALVPSSAANEEAAQATGLTTYDQKQSGKYNIHVNIKDVAIIALDGDRMNSGVGDFGDDYYEDYDLSDLTVNPIFGLLGSDKPSSTTTKAPPPLINLDANTSSVGVAAGAAAAISALTSDSTVEEPIIKNPSTVVKETNKTHSVLIIDPTQTEPTVNGVLLTTPTPSPESLPPKPLVPSAPLKPTNLKTNVSHSIYQSQEIPVKVIFDPSRSHEKLLSGERPSEWQSRQPYRQQVPRRRITPPPQSDYDTVQHHGSTGNLHRNVMHNKLRRNCIPDGNGRCQNANRRFNSPTL